MASNYTQKWNDAFREGTTFKGGPANIYMEIDYNVAVEGRVTLKFMAYDYNSVLAGGQNVLWQATHDRDISKDVNNNYLGIDYLKFGGEYGHASNWYYDNVTFIDYTVIPEPGTMLALGSGPVGLVGFAIHRRK
ncbi:MAG: PEP-CTERM sorting domain-containing protein [Armatimonadota bacterium]